VVHHGAALARKSGEQALAEAVVSGDFTQMAPRLQALLEYAVALTVSPHQVQRSDVQRLQDAGLSAREVIDANQVVSYFNYVNRIAEGLGVELEDSWPEQVRQRRRYGLRERRGPTLP
jgi:uncharacterized peroxidase-related enzyme